ncbi:putative tetraketide alpha-pyrone reductase 1-like [Capsicum annuum]|nr:putative tetraketide alpha-pyrone reductase 1-like [Capsicum annuum]
MSAGELSMDRAVFVMIAKNSIGFDTNDTNFYSIAGVRMNLRIEITASGVTNSRKQLMRIEKTERDFEKEKLIFVDVRDVANAHILAFEVPSANGRYCLVGVNGYSSSVLKIVQNLYPSITLPENFEDGLPITPHFQVSSERAKSLGVKFTSLELSVKDTVESLIEKNFLHI